MSTSRVTALTAHLTDPSSTLELVISRPGAKILHVWLKQPGTGTNPVVPILLVNLPPKNSNVDRVNLSHVGSMLQFCEAIPRTVAAQGSASSVVGGDFEILKTEATPTPCISPDPDPTVLNGLDALQAYIASTEVPRINGEPQCSGQQIPT